MARPKKVQQKEETMETSIEVTNTAVMTPPEKLSIDEMPLETMRDYRLYNEEARRLNKVLRKCVNKIKQCPESLHPTERVIFYRKDQPSNPLDVYISDEKIDFQKKLVPGKTYDLPKYVISILASKGKAVWEWYEKSDGSRDTRVSGKDPRFSIRPIYNEMD